MKKIIYIIPGLGENCGEVRYKKLAQALEEKGYQVNPVNPDWYRPISEQIFPVEKDAIIFGFSLGAILAYLVAQKYPCQKLILASISPIHKFSFKSFEADLMEHMEKSLATAITKDIKSVKVSLNTLKMPLITLAGEQENLPADFLIPKTNHRITTKYIKCIQKLV